jgi:putative molybdopterin biosynthesis protein
MPGKLLDIKEVQEALRLSERTVFRLIKSGELKGFKAGRAWRFEESDIQDYIQRQRQKAAQQIAREQEGEIAA